MTTATATEQSLCSITHKGQPVEMSKATHIYLNLHFLDWLDDDSNRNHYIYTGFINPHFGLCYEDDIDCFIEQNADLMGEFLKSLSPEKLVEEIYNEVLRLEDITDNGDIQVSWNFSISE